MIWPVIYIFLRRYTESMTVSCSILGAAKRWIAGTYCLLVASTIACVVPVSVIFMPNRQILLLGASLALVALAIYIVVLILITNTSFSDPNAWTTWLLTGCQVEEVGAFSGPFDIAILMLLIFLYIVFLPLLGILYPELVKDDDNTNPAENSEQRQPLLEEGKHV